MPHDLKLWCEDCQKGYEGACTEHGPLTHVSDTEIGTRARRSLPNILELQVDNDQIGVYAKSALAKRLQFGPLQGVCVEESISPLQVQEQIKSRFNIVYKLVQENDDLVLLNTLHEDHSNWMIFVRPAEQKSEQNLVAFQYKGEIFFATIKEVPAKSELKVWYSRDYAEKMGASVLSDEGTLWQFRTRLKFVCPGCKIQFSSASSLSNHRCPKAQRPTKKEIGIRARKGKKLSTRPKTSSPVPSTSRDIKEPTPSTSRVGAVRLKRSATKDISIYSAQLTDSSDSEPEATPGRVLPFSCSVCEKAFQSPGKLKQHSYSHTGERPFACTLCQKSFSSRFKLGRHQLIHTSVRQHQCPLCKRSFRRKDHLKNHIQIHDPNKQFKCDKPDCGKEYSSFMSYRKHCATHAAEEGDLECKICSEMFDNKDDLMYHLKVHVGAKTAKSPTEKKFQCDHCDRKFFTRKDVKRHLVVHTGKRDFICSICPQKFGRKDHLVRHIKKSHGTAEPSKIDVDPLKIEVDPLYLPGPSSAPQARSPEIGMTSSTSASSGDQSFSSILPEDFASESPKMSDTGPLHTAIYGTRSYTPEIKLFEGVKEDPELTASVESLSSNNDDFLKMFGMYLPAPSMSIPSTSILDAGTSTQQHPSQIEDPLGECITEPQQPLLLEAGSVYGVPTLDPLIVPMAGQGILEYTQSSGLGHHAAQILEDPSFIHEVIGVAPMTCQTDTATSTTSTTTTTTSLPGFDQAFP